MSKKLNRAEYRDKVLGCWLGKNIGGTVGAPFEWQRQVNNITFYPESMGLKGEAMPNDDLDIQLLWLCAMEEKGIDVNAHRLADYWCTYVTPHWAEYGNAKTNMRQGLPPPLCGTFNNVYKNSCGSYIRSEIWACVAPGAPWKAAKYAYEDAILDHGDGEGLYAEIFMAALESAAFVISDLRECIKVGLSFIPADCGVAKAVNTTLDCFDKKMPNKKRMPWIKMRDIVLEQHRGRLMGWAQVSADDKAKGFDTGELGYDVPSNIAFTLGGLLWGGDDFGEVQCICVNLGEDTDCTAATAGSVWGILYGAKKIPQKWIDPIGRGIKTVTLNLGELGYFGNQLPQNVDNLTDRTIAIAEKIQRANWFSVVLSDDASDYGVLTSKDIGSTDQGKSIWEWSNGPRYDFDLLSVHIDYGEDGPLARPDSMKRIRVTFRNTYKTQLNLSLKWYAPSDWEISPNGGFFHLLGDHLADNKPQTAEFTFVIPEFPRSTVRAVLEITAEGRPMTALVPLTFLDGRLYKFPTDYELPF